MIQNIIIERIKRNAKAQAQFEKIRRADEIRIKREQAVRPILKAPKMSLAEVRFWQTYET